MLSNERTKQEQLLFDQRIELWQLLSDTPIFKNIFRIQCQSASLKVALEADSAPDNMCYLSAVAEIIQKESEELTEIVAEWLVDHGITATQLNQK